MKNNQNLALLNHETSSTSVDNDRTILTPTLRSNSDMGFRDFQCHALIPNVQTRLNALAVNVQKCTHDNEHTKALQLIAVELKEEVILRCLDGILIIQSAGNCIPEHVAKYRNVLGNKLNYIGGEQFGDDWRIVYDAQ